MKIQVLADLHNEFEEYSIRRTDADVVVLAGDIGDGPRGIELVARQIPDKPVVFIAGNHEFYEKNMDEVRSQMAAAASGSNVRYIENEAFTCEGVRFLGCTLWTDFALFGGGTANEHAMRASAQSLNDYKAIRTAASSRLLTPADTLALHLESRRWLECQLSEQYAGPTVVVTHHAPSSRSVPPCHADDPASAAFASNMEDLIAAYHPALWIHGHTHFCVDYVVGRTRVLSNQRGYPEAVAPGFGHRLTAEV